MTTQDFYFCTISLPNPHFKVPENRHQRRQNASTTEQQQQQQQQPTAVSPPRKNVSKEEGSDKYHYYGVYRGLSITNLVARTRGHHDNTRSGLKIIQSYFNNNRTDDQLEFPPLGQAQQQQEQEQQPEAQQEWNLASQMKNMVCSFSCNKRQHLTHHSLIGGWNQEADNVRNCQVRRVRVEQLNNGWLHPRLRLLVDPWLAKANWTSQKRTHPRRASTRSMWRANARSAWRLVAMGLASANDASRLELCQSWRWIPRVASKNGKANWKGRTTEIWAFDESHQWNLVKFSHDWNFGLVKPPTELQIIQLLHTTA